MIATLSSSAAGVQRRRQPSLHNELELFNGFGAPTSVQSQSDSKGSDGFQVPIYQNEFWTSKQRAASRLHEISYRACFKPQLPRFFIERLTQPGDMVLDPFMGRGTTLLEAALLGRTPLGCDANPLCRKLIAPRLNPPAIFEVTERLEIIDFNSDVETPDELSVFYHPRTLRHLCALRAYLLKRERRRQLDSIDEWIQMVALNRLTGHSPGFFSVYTLPPNQAVSIESQARINKRLRQKPDFRSVPELILAKTKSLLGNLTDENRRTLHAAAAKAKVLTCASQSLPQIPDGVVDLVVTSPPFLNVVDYAADNWLRCWFVGIESRPEPFQTHANLDNWRKDMESALAEIYRVVRPGGWVAFEVGEIQRGKIQLEDTVIPAGISAGFEPELVLINSQKFTKTANCWGVRNNDLGTNTNRIVLFQRPGNSSDHHSFTNLAKLAR